MTSRFTSFSRRQLCQTVAGAAAAAAATSLWTSTARAEPPPIPDLTPLLPRLHDLRDKLLKKCRTFIDANQLTRPDGYVYTVDIGQALIVMAQAADAAGYTTLRDHVEKNLIRDDRSDPYTRGFVPWRVKAGEAPDASGTTEALRLARGLWIGSRVLNRSADADLARKLLDGYSRHAAVDQGIWIIRNYFNFYNRSFASNSYLVDYDPDFIREVADADKDPVRSRLADDCYAAVKLAIAPSGLFYDIIQPEVATLYPEMNVAAFSPNDIIQFANCCTTAICCARGLPEASTKVLAFAVNRKTDLRLYYLGRTGEPLGKTPITVREFSMLALLASRLGADAQAAEFVQQAIAAWTYCVEHIDDITLFTATEILQALQSLKGMTP